MSSFNINGPSNKPAITEAQNMMNNGGGGNTGYMESGKQKKKKKEEEIDSSILDGEIEDKFERQEDEYEDEEEYYEASSDDKFEKDTKEEPKKSTVKDALFGFIDKVVKKSEKSDNKDDDNPGGDFLSLSGKDI